MKRDITVIGNSVIDVMARPVSAAVFEIGSWPVGETKLAFGGDALNEAVVLTRFGKNVQLISKVGQDEAGARILGFLRDNGIPADSVAVEAGMDTSVNIVLIDEKGERYFLTNPAGSQRKLTKEDVAARLVPSSADIVSFASIFVSPMLDIPAMEELFRRIKERPGRILAADMTKAKRGERLSDLRGLLPFVDYIFPNEAEAELLTGDRDPYRNAALLVEAGASCVVLKRGERGCLIRTKEEMCEIPAYPAKRCADTTGAGDCFAAGFLWALSEKFPLPECGRFACAAASCAVEQMGATDGIISIEEPKRRYRKLCGQHELLK